MMKNKEDTIRNAWIDVVGLDMFNSISVDKKGWLNFKTTKEFHSWEYNYPTKFCSKNYDPWKKGADSHIQDVSIRPVVLLDLEKNNGWKSISEEVPQIGDKIISYRDLGERTTEEIETVDEQFLKYYEMNGVTHWKVYKSKPPLWK